MVKNNNSNNNNNNKSLVEINASRSPQELYEIVSIIGEIMPKLPSTGVFAIDDVLKKAGVDLSPATNGVQPP